MMPSEDFRTKIQSVRENIFLSRQQVLGDKSGHSHTEPPYRAGDVSRKELHELELNDTFWKASTWPDQRNNSSKLQYQRAALPEQGKRLVVDREKLKEDLAEKCANACNFWDSFGKRRPQEMVRVGEFSPQNPSLQTTGRSLLGLGEYEERRRQLLQKKREEYHQELTQIAQAQKLQSIANRSASPVNAHRVTRDCCTQTDLSLLTPGQPFSVDVQSSNAIPQMKGSALFDFQNPVQSLSLPEVPGLGALTPRSQSPNSLDIRRTELTVPDNVSQIGGLSEVRLRQLRHQEDLRRQIEEKQRLEAERREKESREEEALARRVAEQQARLQAEFEEEERLRRQKEREKQYQTEEFLRRQEQLLLESEQLKLEQRRKRMEALTALADAQQPAVPLKAPEQAEESALQPQEQVVQEQAVEKEKKAPRKERQGRNAHLVPAGPAAPLSILKSASPPPRSPRETLPVRADEQREPPSPRALIKVLEGPTVRRPPRNHVALEDSLPIPLLRQTRTPSPCKKPKPAQRFPPVLSTRSHPTSAVLQPSEAMQRLEDKWKVPAVQKNVMTKRKVGQWGDSSQSHVVLTQLGSFRRQLQEEHMRMEEKVREFERQPRQEGRQPRQEERQPRQEERQPRQEERDSIS